jgi:hypothetical protein
MLALLAILIGAGDIDREVRPKAPPPVVIPIPTGAPIRWDYQFSTDWTPVTRSQRIWRTAKRLDDSGRWEESVIGQPGGRVREIIAESDSDRTFATTGRNPAGSGGVGEGFEWSVFVGGSWTAGLDVEFATNGPRIVVALTHYPFEGVTHHYGWSVLSNELVSGLGWHFDVEDLRALYRWPRYWAVVQLYSLWLQFQQHREE